MPILDDPNADARSLMNRRPCVCDGKANGIVCKHFWGLDQRFRAANAEAVRRGDVRRNCTLTDAFMLEFTEQEKPTFCNRYEPRKTEGLVALVQRAVRAALFLGPKGGAGYVPYDADFDSYKPVTTDDIAKLREEMPDRAFPSLFGGMSGGKSPDTFSFSDIANGPQIGMLKPGEKVPGLELSKAAEAALDAMFTTGATPTPVEPTTVVTDRTHEPEKK